MPKIFHFYYKASKLKKDWCLVPNHTSNFQFHLQSHVFQLKNHCEHFAQRWLCVHSMRCSVWCFPFHERCVSEWLFVVVSASMWEKLCTECVSISFPHRDLRVHFLVDGTKSSINILFAQFHHCICLLSTYAIQSAYNPSSCTLLLNAIFPIHIQLSLSCIYIGEKCQG